MIEAEPEAIFDGFIAMYDSQRPDWVTGSGFSGLNSGSAG